jgi:hypothetical protein
VYEETAGLTVGDVVTRTKKVGNMPWQLRHAQDSWHAVQHMGKSIRHWLWAWFRGLSQQNHQQQQTTLQPVCANVTASTKKHLAGHIPAVGS